MIKKVLVANRGEIAMRIFRTCRVMNIPTVAIYTHVDRGALHVRYAEEAYCISEDEGDTSYLKPDLILEIAKKTGAAIHPGYGFLSENADFARRCEEEGVIFIGPSADVIAKMGIKTEARKIMKEAGVPVVPGTEKPVTDLEDAKKVAAEVGYPIMLKALAGGGGKVCVWYIARMRWKRLSVCLVPRLPTHSETMPSISRSISRTPIISRCRYSGINMGT